MSASPLQPVPPCWVEAAVHSGPFTRFSTQIAEATSLTAHALSDAVATSYRSIGAHLRERGHHPLRIWNFVPRIQDPLGAEDRYMAFNAGRFAAYADWYGNASAFASALPTASAVGIDGDALWIHVLAAESPGVPIENPRQTPSYRYSPRYGVRPPCFARATRVGSLLFIGGTASIVGEDSRHAGDIEAQTHETLANIAALIARALDANPADPLERLRDLRVHVREARDAARVGAIVNEVAPRAAHVELVRADLCRKELLVEIEGRAEL